MSRQDADDDSSDSPDDAGNGDETPDDIGNGDETAQQAAGADGENRSTDQDSVDSEQPGDQSLEEIAEEPEGDVDEALSDIQDDEAAETTVEMDGIEVDEEFREQVANLSTDETVRLVAALQSEVSDLETALEEERERADDLESRLARKQADFQNYKERQERERERVREQAAEDVIERFVEVRDNLVRALEQDADADIRSGVESTLSLFDDELDRAGVSVIDPEEGANPDPRRHEVLVTVAGEQPSGTISDTHRPGYEMGESVIRPAQVAVSDGSLREDEDEEDEGEEESDADDSTHDEGEKEDNDAAATEEESEDVDTAATDDESEDEGGD